MVAYRLPFLSKSKVAIHLAYTNVNCRFLFLSIVILALAVLLNHQYRLAKVIVSIIGKHHGYRTTLERLTRDCFGLN